MAKLQKAVLLRDYSLEGEWLPADSVIEQPAEAIHLLVELGIADTNKAAIDYVTKGAQE